jgi:hypothetical protein
VEYTLYLITDQSLVSSILMIFCTTIQTYFQVQLLLALNGCGLKNKLQYPEFQEFLSANDIICLVESKTDGTDEILLPDYIFKMKNRNIYLIGISAFTIYTFIRTFTKISVIIIYTFIKTVII